MAASFSSSESETESEISSIKEMLSQIKHNSWDPERCSDWDKVKPSEGCLLRVKRDILSIYKEPIPGVCVVPDKEDMTKFHALITGPFGTPYEGGFFYFIIRCPPNYPIKAPRVKFMTTAGGTVRFNPNLYKNGKVCLSMLGTWTGPGWSPANSLSTVLLSIQSLLNDFPYHNEPGYESKKKSGDADKYNEIVLHETLRVAVCQMLTGDIQCPQTLRDVMQSSFGSFYEYYISTCHKNMGLQGKAMQDPFGGSRGNFNYKSILEQLELLKTRFCTSDKDTCSDSDLSDTDSDTKSSPESSTPKSPHTASSTPGPSGQSGEGDKGKEETANQPPS